MAAELPINLSAVSICKNEQQDLPGFIDNMLLLADEIVLVDDGSTDSTLAIAQANPRVRVVVDPRRPGEGFAHQRNKATLLARGQWLLHCDIDMRLSRELALSIRRAMEDPAHDVWSFRRQNYFLNRPLRYSGSQYWWEPWLIRRGLGTFEGLVHEKLRFDVPRERTERLNGVMYHLGDKSFRARLAKNSLYSAFEADRANKQPKAFPLLRAMGAAARQFTHTYVRNAGFLDGRVGLCWSLYQFAGTINRELLIAAERGLEGSREQLERDIRREMAGWDSHSPC